LIRTNGSTASTHSIFKTVGAAPYRPSGPYAQPGTPGREHPAIALRIQVAHPLVQPIGAGRCPRRAAGLGAARRRRGKARLVTDPGGTTGPRDVLAVLQLDGIEHQGSDLNRTDVEIAT
jgi:hypothetical protein